MKKFFSAVALTVLTVILALSASGCAKYKEVAGTYELISLSGQIYNVNITENSYEYYTIILEADGKATVKSKAKGGAAYEASATFTYEDGKISMITKDGSASVTEEMDYEDGIIKYEMDTGGMKLKMVFERVD